MRRLMANDIAYGVVLLAFVAAVVAWVYWPKPQRTVVHEQTRTGPTLVIQTPPLTPLQARRAKRTAAAKSPDSATPHRSRALTPSSSPAAPKSAARPKASTGIPAPKKHKTTRKKPTATQPAPSPPAQTTPSPPPAVTVPLPSVCLPPIKVGTCP